MIWSKATAIAHREAASGYPEAPQANLGTTAISFADIDVSSWFNGVSGSKSAIYSSTYFAVMVDGVTHVDNASVSATLGWSNVDTK